MEEQLVRAVQGRLKELGWYVGRIDGLAGPLTDDAVTDFKAECGLWARPFVGPITLTRLFSKDAPKRPEPKPVEGEPAWLAEARRSLGLRETPGRANNPTIMDWADDLDQWYPDDATPWCGLAVAKWMAVGAPDDPQNFNRLGARNWLKYGRECKAVKGAIAVFWRTHPTRSWNGHVALLVGEDASTWHVLGGNQSDAVTITRISKDRLLGFRWPVSVPLPGESALASVASGAVSINEA